MGTKLKIVYRQSQRLLSLSNMTEPNYKQTKPDKTEGYPPIPIFSKGLLIGKRPFQNVAMPEN